MVMSKKIKKEIFRCTEEDSELLERYKDLGYKNKSDFIRKAIKNEIASYNRKRNKQAQKER